MRQYQEQKDWTQDSTPVTGYAIGVWTIPPEPANKDYAQMQREVAAGEAEILPAVNPGPGPIQITVDDRVAILEAELDELKAAFERHKNAGAFTPAGHGGPR